MAIPKKWSYIDGQLYETLSVEQFPIAFDIMLRDFEPSYGIKRLTFIKKM